MKATRVEFMNAMEKFLNESEFPNDTVLEISGKTKEWTSFFKEVSTTQYPKVDAEDLPYDNNSFDCVIMNQVLEHCKRPWICVEEAARVLKGGGMLIMSSPFIYQVHEFPGDYFRYTPEGLVCLGQAAGLSEVLLSHRSGNPLMLKHAIDNPSDRSSPRFIQLALLKEDQSKYFMKSTVVMRK